MNRIKESIVYGPVLSRRLGISLGINLLPIEKKICSLDCLYCECGWTEIHTDKVNENYNFPTIDNIKESLINKILETNIRIEHITFAGNGEPTLHPDFPIIVDEIIKIRDKFLPEIKIAILSNSTTLNNDDIKKAISKLNLRIMKLDAGNEETFIKYNRPSENIKFSDIVNGLMDLKDIIIQSLFTEGQSGNYNEKNISDWKKLIIKIQPSLVQLYSLDRNYPSKEILPVTQDKLKKIQNELMNYKIKSEVY